MLTLFGQIFYVVVIGIVGLIGNLLVIAVYIKKTFKTSSAVFILALASVDLIFCCTTPLTIYHIITDGISPNLQICQIVKFVSNFAVYSSIVICVVIAFDRYFAVIRPHHKIITIFRAKLLVGGCFILSVILHVPIITSSNIKHFNNFSDEFTNNTKLCETSSTSTVGGIIGSVRGMSFLIWLLIIALIYVRIYFAVRKRIKVHNGIELIGHQKFQPLGRGSVKHATSNGHTITTTQSRVTSLQKPPEAGKSERKVEGKSSVLSISQRVSEAETKNSYHTNHCSATQSIQNTLPISYQSAGFIGRKNSFAVSCYCSNHIVMDAICCFAHIPQFI